MGDTVPAVRTGRARPTGRSPRPRPESPWTAAERALSGLVVVLLASRLGDLPLDLTLGTAAALALTPVWWPAARASRGFLPLAGLTALSVASGAWLSEVARADHVVSQGVLVRNSLLVVGIVAGVGVVLWARRHMPVWGVAALFGVGLLLGIRPGQGLAVENLWRFGLSVPLTVLALALAMRTGRTWVQVAVALALGGMSALNDGRSTFAILVLTAVLVLWQVRRRSVTRRTSAVRVAALLAVVAYVAYSAGQAAILEGYLGEETQARTEEQLQESGSLILGGRPEVGATIALFAERPYGYGAGTVPSTTDVLVAKAGMAAIHYDPDNGYVERFMFGGRFELHSVMGDLWVWFGLPGLALAVGVLVLVCVRVVRLMAVGQASAVLIFLATKTFWNLLFSPVYSSAPLLVLTLGLLLVQPGRSPDVADEPVQAGGDGTVDGAAAVAGRRRH